MRNFFLLLLCCLPVNAKAQYRIQKVDSTFWQGQMWHSGIAEWAGTYYDVVWSKKGILFFMESEYMGLHLATDNSPKAYQPLFPNQKDLLYINASIGRCCETTFGISVDTGQQLFTLRYLESFYDEDAIRTRYNEGDTITQYVVSKAGLNPAFKCGTNINDLVKPLIWKVYGAIAFEAYFRYQFRFCTHSQVRGRLLKSGTATEMEVYDSQRHSDCQ